MLQPVASIQLFVEIEGYGILRQVRLPDCIAFSDATAAPRVPRSAAFAPISQPGFGAAASGRKRPATARCAIRAFRCEQRGTPAHAIRRATHVLDRADHPVPFARDLEAVVLDAAARHDLPVLCQPLRAQLMYSRPTRPCGQGSPARAARDNVASCSSIMPARRVHGTFR